MLKPASGPLPAGKDGARSTKRRNGVRRRDGASQGRLSSAGAFIAAGRQVSHSIGFVVAGAIFAIRQDFHLGAMAGEPSVAKAVVASFSDAMVVASLLCFAGATVSYFRGRG